MVEWMKEWIWIWIWITKSASSVKYCLSWRLWGAFGSNSNCIIIIQLSCISLPSTHSHSITWYGFNFHAGEKHNPLVQNLLSSSLQPFTLKLHDIHSTAWNAEWRSECNQAQCIALMTVQNLETGDKARASLIIIMFSVWIWLSKFMNHPFMVWNLSSSEWHKWWLFLKSVENLPLFTPFGGSLPHHNFIHRDNGWWSTQR